MTGPRSCSWGSKPGCPKKLVGTEKRPWLWCLCLALSPENRGRGWTQTDGDRQDEPTGRGVGSGGGGGAGEGPRGDQLVTKWSGDRAGDGSWRQMQPPAGKSIGISGPGAPLFVRCVERRGRGWGARRKYR